MYVVYQNNLRLSNFYHNVWFTVIQDDLRGGGRRLCQRGGRLGGRKSLKVSTIELEVISKRVLALFLLKVLPKWVASEASEQNIENIYRFGEYKIIGPRPLRGGDAPGAPPPPLDPLVIYLLYWQGRIVEKVV